LGRAAAEEGSTSESPSAASLTEFEKLVKSAQFKELGIPASINSFDNEGVLPNRSKKRLARVQGRLVGLLEYLELKLVESQYPRYRRIKRRAAAKSFTLFTGSAGQRRERAA
jgi:exonuclease VII small subunit